MTIREQLTTAAISGKLLTHAAYAAAWFDFASWEEYRASLFVSKTHRATFLLFVAEAL